MNRTSGLGRASALLMAASLLVAACGQESEITEVSDDGASAVTTAPADRETESTADLNADRAELDAAEDLFSSTVGGNYVLTFDIISQVSAEAGSIRVEVADGRATNVTYPDAMTEQILPQVPLLTVTDFFDRARSVLADGGVVEIEFDEFYGHPLTMTLDPIPNAIDDEMSVIVQSVEPLEVSFEPDGY